MLVNGNEMGWEMKWNGNGNEMGEKEIDRLSWHSSWFFIPLVKCQVGMIRNTWNKIKYMVTKQILSNGEHWKW